MMTYIDYLLKSRGQRPNPAGSGKLVVLSRYDALKLHAGQFPDILRAVIANQDALSEIRDEKSLLYCSGYNRLSMIMASADVCNKMTTILVRTSASKSVYTGEADSFQDGLD